MVRVGVIGIGSIGAAVCKNLLNNGLSLCIYNRSQNKTNQFIDNDKVIIAESSTDVFFNCEITIIALTDDTAVRNVILTNDYINENYNSEKSIIDLSSISSELAQECFYHCKKLGFNYFDSPISGGVEGTLDGSLSIMVGGDESKFDHIKSTLNLLGKSVVYLGRSGIGSIAKQINQIIVASYLVGIGEAFAFAKAMDIDISTLKGAIEDGYCQSRVLEVKFPNIKSDNYPLGGRVSLHLKDLRNAISSAAKNNLKLPTTEFYEKLYNDAVEIGLSDSDHSAIHKLLKEKLKK